MRTATIHGGGLDAAIARFGASPTGWLDLSTGINPAAVALPELDPAVWSRLPDSKLQARCVEAARAAYGVPRQAGIVAAPGSQALISLLPFVLPVGDVAILEPTYGEHRAGFAAAGHRVVSIGGPGELPDGARVVVVVNPNNPDGRRTEPAALLGLHAEMARRGGLLVVDEAFADAMPELSVAGQAGAEGLLIHRSFGKFYGLAGIRLGFALTTPALAETLAARLGPWAVSGPALAIGAAVLADPGLWAEVMETVALQAERRDRVLADAGHARVGATPLFATIETSDAHALFEGLCRRHILTRPFAYRADWLRFGNPKDAAEAARLAGALADLAREDGR
ncbi:threonine-phosphate decarboxylase CobD [Aurantimonas sp. 22II-16-19i]|uniref:threonine-phosphate decarboxylase CobD n=1 Tax=Aurantimonas sp. 22II-16-19i TaxID=1317114 RepID=UPI0009F7B9C7|nr:threonine-phosphate decarboxylase CobD [Aurantimonas sp. 22II-16-19i]ORE94783.1 class I/II aminotransferase [Aurantimonas sp. 22II-16-19i]